MEWGLHEDEAVWNTRMGLHEDKTMWNEDCVRTITRCLMQSPECLYGESYC